MRDLKEVKQEIRELEDQIDSLQRKVWKLESERCDIEAYGRKERVKSFFKERHYYIKVDGLTNYHCTLMTLYEFLVRSQNGFKVRKFQFNYSDGDVYVIYSKEHISDPYLQDSMEYFKEISEEEFNRLYDDLVLNPERAEKWAEEHKDK